MQRSVDPPHSPIQARVVPNQSQPQQRPIVANEDALDEVESLLVRMLIGTVRFPFVRLPRWIHRTLRFLFPTAVRVIRICFLAAVLCLIVLGPAAYVFYFDSINNWLSDKGFSSLTSPFRNHPVVTSWTCYTWAILTGIGAVWGAMYVTRKRWLQRKVRRSVG